MSEDMKQGRTFEILTADPVRTRRKPKLWSDEEKSQILEEALAPGANVSAVGMPLSIEPSTCPRVGPTTPRGLLPLMFLKL